MVDSDAVTQSLTDNLNTNAQISAWCNTIINTTVAQSPGAWYQPFMTNLAIAQDHANTFLNNIGPDAWSTLPSAIVNYGQMHNNAMGDVQDILNQVGSGDLSTDQITEIQQIFEALSQYLQQLQGTSTDTNLAVPPNPPPAQPTLWGSKNDLITFRTNITSDNQNLTTGQQGAAQEVNLLEADEATMNNNINTLNAEITVWTNDILASEIGIGVSIFVAVVGIALAIPTGGVSLVATGIGVAGLGGSIAGTVVYSDKVKDAQNQIAKDQQELTTDQQQVNALNGIINSFNGLETLNQTAQSAAESMVNTFTALISDTGTTITDLNNADSGTAKGILEKLDIQDAMTAWNNLVSLAQGILNSTQNPQVLTPPTPTTNS